MCMILKRFRPWFWGAIACTAIVASSATRLVAQDDAPADTPAASEEAKPAEQPAEGAMPTLPPYFSGTSADPAKPSWPDPTGGAAGAWATPAGDAKGDLPDTLTPGDLYARITHNMFSINMCWTLITGALVMFMQAGFSMVEGGLSRQKNACHTWSMNFMIYPLGGLGFWVYGFAIGWGNWFNGPVPPGWYASLGPGLAVLNQGRRHRAGGRARWQSHRRLQIRLCWAPRVSACKASTTSA